MLPLSQPPRGTKYRSGNSRRHYRPIQDPVVDGSKVRVWIDALKEVTAHLLSTLRQDILDAVSVGGDVLLGRDVAAGPRDPVLMARLTERELTVLPQDDMVGNVNRSLRGRANYCRKSSSLLCKARHHAENRLYTRLMKRH